MTTSLSETKSRLPRLKRVDEAQLPGIRLAARDREIIKAVYDYRALTSRQIESLFFSRSNSQSDNRTKINSRCQYRLQLLFQHSFLYRDEQPTKSCEGRKPLVYWLDTRGAQLVASLEGCEIGDLGFDPKDRDVSSLFLDHLLATNDFMVALTIAAKSSGFAVAKWLDEKKLRSREIVDHVVLTGPGGGKQKVAVVADGYFVLDAGEHTYSHFLEIDRANETVVASSWGRRDYARKVSAYIEYFKSGKYTQRYQSQGLRILTVTTGEKRLANLKAITERSGGKARFWFTTFDKITPETLLKDAIWNVAGRDGLHALIW